MAAQPLIVKYYSRRRHTNYNCKMEINQNIIKFEEEDFNGIGFKSNQQSLIIIFKLK